MRDYQEQAINAWVDNGYKGFYVMATGTGKTWTAIYSAKELLKKYPCMVVICAPYKHLVKQWAEDLEKVFTESKIIMVSSENPESQSANDKISKCKNCTLECSLEEVAILQYILSKPDITQKELAQCMGKSERTIKTKIALLQNKNCIKRVNGKRYGKWEVLVENFEK